MEKMRDKNGKPEKKSSRTTLIMAAGLLGILLIGIAPMLKTDGAKKQFQQETVPSAEEYAAALESRLEGILGRIDGVGEVEVMITLKSGYTYTYAVTEKVNSDVSEEYKSDDQRKSQQKNTTEQSYVMVEDGGSPLVTALNEPEIKGVVVRRRRSPQGSGTGYRGGKNRAGYFLCQDYRFQDQPRRRRSLID